MIYFMISLTEFLKENLTSFEIEIDEELGYINPTDHTLVRMNGKNDKDYISTNWGNITYNEIKEAIQFINDIIENLCLSNKIELNKSNIGIKYKFKKGYWFNIIFVITNFNKENFKYKIKIITLNKDSRPYNLYDCLFIYEVNEKNKKLVQK